MKQVATVTAKQFGYIYLNGIPFSPIRVKRFVNKGQGIKVQDIVIFDHEMTANERVLTYLKNAIYAEEEEREMVKEFVRASELQRLDPTVLDGVSKEIKKELSEEGVCITNDGVFLCPPEPRCDEEGVRPCGLEEDLSENYVTEIAPEILAVLSNDEKRTISIMLQSSLKAAIDSTDCEGEELEEEALKIMKWVDRNSTQILPRAEAYLKAGSKK